MIETALSYGRASRDPKNRGTSVTTQLRENAKWAAASRVTITHTIRDDNRSASAWRAREREGFEQALGLIRQRVVDLVLVWEMSRATRDLDDWVRLRGACMEAGVDLVYKGQRYDLSRPDDRFRTSLDVLLAEREAGDIRERNLRTVQANAEKGRPHGRMPYGYRRIYDPASGALVTQTPFQGDGETPLAEAQVVMDAASAVLRGATLRSICRDLNARGVPSPRKPRKKTLDENPAGAVTTWIPATIRQILLNPTIAGRRVHRGEDIGPAAWDPIIEYGTWLQVRSVLTDPARVANPAPRGPQPRHLLSGIARCGECGARLKAATNLSRIPRAYTCRSEGCMRVTVTAPRVDERVEAVLKALFSRPENRKALVEAQRRRDEAAQKAPDVGSLIAAKERELGEVEALRSAGDLTLRAYAAETKRIEQAIEDLRARETSAVSSPALRRLLSAPTLLDGWVAADLVDQREIVRMLLDVTVKRATRRGKAFDGERVDIHPGPLLVSDLGARSTAVLADEA